MLWVESDEVGRGDYALSANLSFSLFSHRYCLIRCCHRCLSRCRLVRSVVTGLQVLVCDRRQNSFLPRICESQQSPARKRKRITKSKMKMQKQAAGHARKSEIKPTRNATARQERANHYGAKHRITHLLHTTQILIGIALYLKARDISAENERTKPIHRDQELVAP